jgi:hypothetical protein
MNHHHEEQYKRSLMAGVMAGRRLGEPVVSTPQVSEALDATSFSSLSARNPATATRTRCRAKRRYLTQRSIDKSRKHTAEYVSIPAVISTLVAAGGLVGAGGAVVRGTRTVSVDALAVAGMVSTVCPSEHFTSKEAERSRRARLIPR